MAHAPLFRPFELGSLTLPNRIVMAPLTRSRADHATGAPTAMNAEYYRQRASAGLIISEATQISPQGQGYVWTPGIHSSDQVDGWRHVTEAVHEAGGRIFLQLWHVGRVSHVSLQPGHQPPVAPSAIKADTKTFLESGYAPVSAPRALEAEEIPGIVRDFMAAAQNAKRAGFDGVEVHAANGYLLDQFLRDGSNTRTDAYGGSIENRVRLTVEVVEAVLRVWHKGRVGIRIAPVSPANDMHDSDPASLFGYLVKCLDALGIAYVHVVEGATRGSRETDFDFAALRKSFRGAYMANNSYDAKLADIAVTNGRADLVAFGRPFIANPDLVERLRRGSNLATPDEATFYGGDAKGYIDYPALTGPIAAPEPVARRTRLPSNASLAAPRTSSAAQPADFTQTTSTRTIPMGRILLAIGAMFFVSRLVKNRRASNVYSRMTPDQKRLVPRRWL